MKELSIADLKAAYLFAQKEKKKWDEQYKTAPESNEEEVKKANEKYKYWSSVMDQLDTELKERIYLIFKV